MEDLKQIQEFFSKPLNEISKEDAWKKFQKEKSVTDKTIKAARKDFEKEWEAGKLKENSRRSPDFILTDPAEIKYTESFGTGIKAPGVLHHANEGAFLGAEGAYIIVLPGGTFYVDEDKEEAMPIWPLKDQDQELHQVLDYTPFSPKYETWKSWIKRPKTLDEDKKLTYNDFVRMVKNDMMVGAAPDEMPSDKQVASRAKAYYNDYLQGASVDDLFEAKVEVDDETEFKLNLKHLLDKHVVEQGYSLTKEHETDPNLELKVGDYQTQHFHMCPGAKSLYQDIENKVEDMGLAIRSAKLQDALFAMEESALENGANEADVFAAETIADQIMAMASMMGLDKEHSYIQGHVDKIKGAVDKEQVAESSSSEERRIAKRAIRSIAKYRGVSEDEARNDLIRAANELGSLEKAVRKMFETIKLGKQLNEELCDKGKRYIKARQAAGEKSSAYLSGRAVRVCKGQIEWPKKGKKKK